MLNRQKRIISSEQCCVCGQKRCRQSTDHEYINIKELKVIIQNAKMPNKIIDSLKAKTDCYFKKLKEQILFIIDQDYKFLQLHLNKFYYAHLNNSYDMQSFLSHDENGHFDKLPCKKLIKMINILKKSNKGQTFQINAQVNQIKQDLQKFYTQFSSNNQITRLKMILPYSKIVEKSIPEIKLKKSTSDISSNPQQVDVQITDSYTWKNFCIKAKTKVLQLNNKGITDQQLLKQMPKLSSFKNIQQFQARNNKLTSFSCQIIANHMNFIKSLDIRGNKVGDEGISYIINGIPNIKVLLISQTGCTSNTLRNVARGLKFLQKLWYEQNTAKGQDAVVASGIPTLRMASFVGCNLDLNSVTRIKSIFHAKGYVNV